jgi:hypothetical protein
LKVEVNSGKKETEKKMAKLKMKLVCKTFGVLVAFFVHSKSFWHFILAFHFGISFWHFILAFHFGISFWHFI